MQKETKWKKSVISSGLRGREIVERVQGDLSEGSTEGLEFKCHRRHSVRVKHGERQASIAP